MSDEEREALAAEWVLGTLDPAERRAFERQLAEDPALRDLVRRWEERLLPMTAMVEPADPPARVWASIDRTLDGITARPRRRFGRSLRGLWDSVALWRGIGLTATAAAAGLVALIATTPEPPAPAVLLAVLTGTEGAPGWLVEAAASGELSVQPIGGTVADQRVPELWALPPDGGAPVSLGLLDPTQAQRRTLSSAALDALGDATALAISLEPPGGSPTGAPTGPVVQTGALVRRAP